MELSVAGKGALAAALPQVFNGEYGVLVLLPSHLAQAHDEETRRQLRRIEKTILRQMARISQLLGEAAEQPPARPPKTPNRPLLRELLQLQLRGMKREIVLYQRALKNGEGEELKALLAPLQREAQTLLRQLQRLQEDL